MNLNVDITTGCLEFIAALVILNNCRKIYNDKQVKGVSILSPSFFLMWSLWNMYYYPALGLRFSFLCAIGAVVGNALWLVLMLYYTRFPGGRNEKN